MEKLQCGPLGLPPAIPGLHILVLSQWPLLTELLLMQVMCLQNFLWFSRTQN